MIGVDSSRVNPLLVLTERAHSFYGISSAAAALDNRFKKREFRQRQRRCSDPFAEDATQSVAPEPDGSYLL